MELVKAFVNWLGQHPQLNKKKEKKDREAWHVCAHPDDDVGGGFGELIFDFV